MNSQFAHFLLLFIQFKVLRRGSWKNINFEPTESRSNFLNEYQALSHNPWIHHFKAARKNKNVACKSQAIGSRGRNSLSLEAANNSGPIRASNSDLSQQYISSNKGKSFGFRPYISSIFY